MQGTITTPVPALFIGHGNPMNAIEDTAFTRSLNRLGKTLGKPKAILMISAHWLEPFFAVSVHAGGELLYDFFGFPSALYAAEYAAPPVPELAQRVDSLVPGNRTVERPLDHGTWSVLRHLYPAADVPVAQFALNRTLDMQEHLATAQRLQALRDEGVMIIGSGNVTHNLGRLGSGLPAQWAVDFDAAVKEALLQGDMDGLVDMYRTHEHGATAHPTLEHYMPLLYTAALRRDGEVLTFPYEGIELGSISMRSFVIGASA